MAVLFVFWVSFFMEQTFEADNTERFREARSYLAIASDEFQMIIKMIHYWCREDIEVRCTYHVCSE